MFEGLLCFTNMVTSSTRHLPGSVCHPGTLVGLPAIGVTPSTAAPTIVILWGVTTSPTIPAIWVGGWVLAAICTVRPVSDVHTLVVSKYCTYILPLNYSMFNQQPHSPVIETAKEYQIYLLSGMCCGYAATYGSGRSSLRPPCLLPGYSGSCGRLGSRR